MVYPDGQFDPIDREGLEAPMSSANKEGVYQCKKHGSTSTSPSCMQALTVSLIKYDAGIRI